MFGLHGELTVYLFALGGATAVFSCLMTWGVGVRYGRRRALVIPVLAVLAVAALIWRLHGQQGFDRVSVAAIALLFAGPAVAGGLLGLALSGRSKG